MATPVNVFMLGIGGMISSADSSMIDPGYFSEGVNVALVNGRIGTRPPFRTLSASLPDESFSDSNIQGATFYNPAKGQSAQTFAEDSSSIVASAAGRKYLIKPSMDGSYTIENITGGFVGKSDAHIAYLYQAEVYAISQDGLGATWIFDPVNGAMLSPGYNTENKEESKLAAGATVGGYVHGRIFQVVNGRNVLVGDIIHKTNLSDPSNILDTTEQVYWATGAEFAPPSSMGNVLCGAVLPLKNTNHGHGDLMLHCEDGVFSIDLSKYPREDWINMSLVKHVTLDSAARGPYALALFSGDQIYRSRQGVHSLRSQAATGGAIGNPDQSLSSQIGNLLRQDDEALLKFCSLSKLASEERIFVSVGHVLRGSFRWAQGIASYNLTPVDGQGSVAPAWEGVWVPPEEIGGIVQMVNGVFSGRENCYALCHNFRDKKNHLVEVNSSGLDDQIPDGSYRQIECSLTTRSVVSTDSPFSKFRIELGTLFLRNIRGSVEVTVKWRSDTNKEWSICATKKIECESCDPLVGPAPVSYGMPLQIENKEAIRAQFKIEWKGYLEVEALRILLSSADPDFGQDEGNPICLEEPGEVCSSDIYSYLNGSTPIHETDPEDECPPEKQPRILDRWEMTRLYGSITGDGWPGSILTSSISAPWFINGVEVESSESTRFEIPLTVDEGDIITQGDASNEIVIESPDEDSEDFCDRLIAAGGSTTLSLEMYTGGRLTEKANRWVWSGFVRRLKSNNVWDKIFEIYPLAGYRHFNGDIPKLKFRNDESMTPYNFTSSDVFPAGVNIGFQGDGATKYIDTKDSQFLFGTESGRGFACMVSPLLPDFQDMKGRYLGSRTNSTSSDFFALSASYGGGQCFIQFNDGVINTSIETFSPNDIRSGFWSGSARRDGKNTLYRNGVVQVIRELPPISVTSRPITLFAIDYGGMVQDFSNGRMSIAMFKDFVSPNEERSISEATLWIIDQLSRITYSNI